MININGKKVRNLQEQVEYLSDTFDKLENQIPYNGPFDSIEKIPSDKLVDKGIYLIGASEPYTIYRYNEESETYDNLGNFGANGNDGADGAQGPQGIQGDPNVIVIGSNTYSGTTITLPTITLTFTYDDFTSETASIVTLGSSE